MPVLSFPAHSPLWALTKLPPPLPACLPACLCCLPLLALLLQECQAEIGRLSKRVRELQEEASCQLPLALRTFLLNCLLTATACTAD